MGVLSPPRLLYPDGLSCSLFSHTTFSLTDIPSKAYQRSQKYLVP